LKIIQEDVEAIEGFVAHHFPDIAAGFTLPAFTMGYLFFVDWRLAIAASIPMPLTLLLLHMMKTGKLTGQNRNKVLERYHQAIERMHATMVEYVQGMPVVKTFRLGADSYKKLSDTVLSYREIVLNWTAGISPYRAVVTTIVMGGGMFILPLAVWLLQKGEVDAATVILFLLLGTGCFQGMLKAIMITTRMEMITAGVRRIQGILMARPLREPAVPVRPERFDVTFSGVGFRYADDGPPVLQNIDLKLPAGSFTALVGPSGAGKTTVVNLLSRMWDPTEGAIEIGGIPLPKMGSHALADTVGTVFQEVQLLTDSVDANIRMGNETANPSDVEAAAKAASCHDLIRSMPDGYGTIIGDGGDVHLSGGERQRIALARVFLKNPPVVLLDEATSYADAESETQMQEAFARLMPGKTIVVVGHRLSTIVGADQIVVVDKGRIVECGTHSELLKAGGLYRRMWEARSRASAWHMSNKEVAA
ncbi:MAG: ABC transporter ATP-binding protein/permease, partial [Rhodospirillales bacterium]|nr:ABC transporter ATP-binding protein/permease [Rhodospirillales bacterium]